MTGKRLVFSIFVALACQSLAHGDKPQPIEDATITEQPLTEAKVGFAKVQVVDGKVAGLYLPSDCRAEDYDKPIVTVSYTCLLYTSPSPRDS